MRTMSQQRLGPRASSSGEQERNAVMAIRVGVNMLQFCSVSNSLSHTTLSIKWEVYFSKRIVFASLYCVEYVSACICVCIVVMAIQHREPSLPQIFTHSWKKKRIHEFLRGINIKWNTKTLTKTWTQVTNSMIIVTPNALKPVWLNWKLVLWFLSFMKMEVLVLPLLFVSQRW